MHGSIFWSAAALAAVWALWAAFTRWLLAPGFRGGDVAACATIRTVQIYSRLVHRLRVEGRQHIPARSALGLGDRPLILVANHTAGVDPVLIQAALPFEVRWVMAEDMRIDALEPLWRYVRIIFVDRQSGEGVGMREALRHLKSCGSLGVFPEGGIERPPRRLLPFREGIGLLVARTGALVLPVVLEGTPQVDPAWASLWKTSRSRVRFLPVIDFAPAEVGSPAPSRGRARVRGGPEPADISARLREVFRETTGWPLNDSPPRFENGQWWYVDERGTYRPASEFETSA